jgi:UDP-glucuronate decarboxylase
MDSDLTGPINIGNPFEFTMNELATLVIELTDSKSKIRNEPLPTDDPLRRCPDISIAEQELSWTPEVQLREGLELTITWFRELLRS